MFLQEVQEIIQEEVNNANSNLSNIDKIKKTAIDYAPKLAAGIIMLLVGFWAIGKVLKILDKAFEKANIELTLRKFLLSIIGSFAKVMLILSAAGQMGIETTSILAIFGALMVGVGMALNGTIGHFASGVMLMLFKPFKVGDLVTIGGGHTGTVASLNAFNTTLATLDNQRIIVSNSNITGNTITNISGQGEIGVELSFGIGYDSSIQKARELILEVGKQCPWILDTPKQGVVVSELADSAVILATRPFCKSEHYWDTKFYMQENVKKAFDQNGIAIPFNHMELIVKKES